MPLKPGSSRQVVSTNIREMRAAGHPQKQAIAAALRLARQGKAMGGEVSKQAPVKDMPSREEMKRYRDRSDSMKQYRDMFDPPFQDYARELPEQPIQDQNDPRTWGMFDTMERGGTQDDDPQRAWMEQVPHGGHNIRARRAYGGQIGGSVGGKGSMGGTAPNQIAPRFFSNLMQGGGDPWTAAYMSAQPNGQPNGQVPTINAPPPPPAASAPPPNMSGPLQSAPLEAPPQAAGIGGANCPGSYAEGGGVDDLPPVGMGDVSRDVPGYWDLLGKEMPRDELLRPESPDAGAPFRHAIPRIPRAIAPNITSLALGESPDAPPQIEGNAPGKVKSFEDKRLMGAVPEAAGLAGLATPSGPVSVGTRMAARAAPGLAETAIPAVGKRAPALAAEATTGSAESGSIRNPVAGMAAGFGSSMAGATEAKGEEPEEPRIAELEGRIKTYMGQLDALANKKYLTAAENQQVDALDKKITKLENDAAIYSRRSDVGSKAKQIELDRLKGLADTERGARTAITGQDEARRRTEREQINSQITSLRGEKTPLEAAMFGRRGEATRKQGEADRPFRQQHPDAAFAISGIGSAAAGAFPYLTRMQRLGSGNRFVRDWQGYVDKAEGAIMSRDTNAARLYTNQLKGFPEQAAERAKPMSKMGKAGVVTATGLNAALPLEAAVLPEQLDMAFGTPKAKETAWSNFLDPWRVPAALATGTALTFAGHEGPLPRKPLEPPVAASEGAIKGYNALAKEEKAAAKEEKEAAAVKRKGKARARKADGGGIGDADEIAGLRAAIEEENQRTQRAGTGLRYKREFENEHRASPYVNQIERSGNRIEALQDRLEALLPNPLMGPYPKEQPEEPVAPTQPFTEEPDVSTRPPGPQGPAPIVDAPGRQRDYWDSAKKVMFGDPDAMVDTRLKALNRPPSDWSPDERNYIGGGISEAGILSSPSGMILRGPAAARGLGAAARSGGPSGNPTGSMLNASSMGGGPSAAPRSAPRGGPTARDPGPVPTGPWNPPPGSALGPAAGRTVRGTMIPVERVNGRYQSLSGNTRPPRDPNAMPDRRLPGPGRMDTFAVGGPAQSPWFTRDEARHMDDRVTGPLAGPGGGRTDRLPISVPSGSYVVPADIVSGLGQGNTANGMQAMQKMFFSSGPYGTPLMRASRGRGPPRPPRPMKFADGGGVPIMAADGEFIVPPEKVVEIGGGDMDHGHNVLDHFVKLMRQQTIKTLSKLPDPQV